MSSRPVFVLFAEELRQERIQLTETRHTSVQIGPEWLKLQIMTYEAFYLEEDVKLPKYMIVELLEATLEAELPLLLDRFLVDQSMLPLILLY